jgi:hypothetical protein
VILETLEQVVRNIHSGLMIYTVLCNTVKFISQEFQLSSDSLCCFTSILGLKAREPELEIETESEMELKGRPVEGPTREEEDLTGTPVVFTPVAGISVQIFQVAVHFLLRIDVLKKLSLAPPAIF